jgi:hypothetical protein
LSKSSAFFDSNSGSAEQNAWLSSSFPLIDWRGFMQITRRDFNRISALAGIGFVSRFPGIQNEVQVPVSIVKTTDRRFGFRKAVELLGGLSYSENDVYLKCSYNSPDPYPATTHPEVSVAPGNWAKMADQKGPHEWLRDEQD